MKRDKLTVYSGRCSHRTEVFVRERDFVEELTPRPSQQVVNHSPTGFSWGYCGSGPAQLSLAILLDYYGERETALRHYQNFKFKVIGALPQGEDWWLTGRTIEQTIREFEEGREDYDF